MSNRHYRNGVTATVLTSGIDDTTTTLTVTSTAGYPPTPFYMTMARQTGTEEVVLCTDIPLGTQFTVIRGQDGTSPSAQSGGALVEHTSIALDYRQAGIVVVDDSEEGVIQGDSVDDWLGRTLFNSDSREIKVSNGADLMVPLMPLGIVTPYAGAAAPDGWLMCDGSAVSQSSYPGLYAVIGFAFEGDPGGGNFNLPDMIRRWPLGAGTTSGSGRSGTSTVGQSGGDINHRHTGPSHTHTMGTHTHTNPTTASRDPGDTNSAGSHSHTQGSTGSVNMAHTHSNPTTSSTGSHTHATSDTSGAPSSTFGVSATGVFNVGSSTHTHFVSDTTSSSGSHSHTQGSTGSSQGSHSHTNPTSASTGSHTHTMPTHTHTQGSTGSKDPGDTNAGGTQDTGTGNPSYLVINYIIFAGVTGG